MKQIARALTDFPDYLTLVGMISGKADTSYVDTGLAGKSDVGHTHAWDDITDKPTAFTPVAHEHGWLEITGKPSTFAPAAHQHAGEDINSGTIADDRLSGNVTLLGNNVLGTGSLIRSAGTFVSTAGQTYSFPSTSATIARTDAVAQTCLGDVTMSAATINIGAFRFNSGNFTGLSGGASVFANATGGVGFSDAFFRRDAAAVLQLGASAAGVTNYTLKGADRITSDGVGATVTIAGGRNRGASDGGSIIFQTSPQAAAGVTGTLTTRFTINAAGHLICAALPTSSAGLATGTLWNDSGTVKVA